MLGTVDCRYYADAADKLILALRTDGVECVRLEAAWALGSGCCCQPKVVEALDITVAGLETDGNPAERSPRVRDAAAAALANCLACAPPAPPADVLPDPKRKSKERTDETETETAAAGNDAKKASSRRLDPALLERARATLALYQARHPEFMHPTPPAEKSLVGLFKGAESAMAGPEPKMAKPLPAFTAAEPVIAGPEPKLKPFLPVATPEPLPLSDPPLRIPVIRPEEKKDLKPAASLILPQD